jgi:hypothetical protein
VLLLPSMHNKNVQNFIHFAHFHFLKVVLFCPLGREKKKEKASQLSSSFLSPPSFPEVE